MKTAVLAAMLLAGCAAAGQPAPQPMPQPVPVQPPAPECPPPPPSALCRYGPAVVRLGTGWIARHLLPAKDEQVIKDLGQAVSDGCGVANPFKRTTVRR